MVSTFHVSEIIRNTFHISFSPTSFLTYFETEQSKYHVADVVEYSVSWTEEEEQKKKIILIYSQNLIFHLYSILFPFQPLLKTKQDSYFKTFWERDMAFWIFFFLNSTLTRPLGIVKLRVKPQFQYTF